MCARARLARIAARVASSATDSASVSAAPRTSAARFSSPPSMSSLPSRPVAASAATGSSSSDRPRSHPRAYATDAARRDACRLGRAVEQRRAVGRLGRDRQRLVEIGDGLVVCAQRCGPVRRAGEGEARLGGDRIGLRAGIRRLAGGEVVAGQRAGQLVVAERLVVAGHGQVAGAAVATGERAVGDLADQRLHELVLAALRRAAGHARCRAARGARGLAAAGSRSSAATPLDGGERIDPDHLTNDRRRPGAASGRPDRVRRGARRSASAATRER